MSIIWIITSQKMRYFLKQQPLHGMLALQQLHGRYSNLQLHKDSLFLQLHRLNLLAHLGSVLSLATTQVAMVDEEGDPMWQPKRNVSNCVEMTQTAATGATMGQIVIL